jgi:hypothetical protein
MAPMISEERSAQLEAEVRRRIDLYLEHRRDTAPDGPGLDLEDYRALEQGFAWEIVHEPGWEDVLASWEAGKDQDELDEDPDRRG